MFRAILVVSVALVSIGADAGTEVSPGALKSSVEKVKTSCASDMKTHCGDVTPGEGRLAACLKAKEDRLSSDCNSSRMELGEKVSKVVDKTDVAFRKSCGSDIQKLCSDVPSGGGRLLNCLGTHEASVSSSCKQFQDKIAQKIDDYMKKF